MIQFSLIHGMLATYQTRKIEESAERKPPDLQYRRIMYAENVYGNINPNRASVNQPRLYHQCAQSGKTSFIHRGRTVSTEVLLKQIQEVAQMPV
jgi:hypothetical protein